eukprot:SAG31_NODE_13989_length_833_cov_0.983651_1_plen_181_part_00
MQFISSAVVQLEASAPEVVAAMVEQCKQVKMGLSADGTQGISLRSGEVRWGAETRSEGLTHVYGAAAEALNDSATGFVVAISDFILMMSQPWCGTLPAAILDCIEADPTTALAKQFRLFARHGLVPGLRQVSGLLEAHSAVVELPPTDWCGVLFEKVLGQWSFSFACARLIFVNAGFCEG